MRKITKKSILLFILMFLGVTNVYGVSTTCSYEEKARLNEVARKVAADYEVVKYKAPSTIVNPDTGKVGITEDQFSKFKISIYNITDEIYITETNDINEEAKEIYSSDIQDGVYSFENEDTSNIVRYTYKVYSNLEDCRGEILTSFVFLKPKSNIYSGLTMCEGLEAHPFCAPYITEDLNFTESELEEKIIEVGENSSSVGKEEPAIVKNTNSFIFYTIGGIVLIGGIGATIYFIIKKRRVL